MTNASDKAQALVTHFAALADLKEYFQHQFEKLLNANGAKWDDFKLESVNENGFVLATEHTRCGDTDHDEHWFALAELDVDVEELNRRENARIAKERADNDARNAAFKARQAAETERHDRAEYARLKLKFEGKAVG